MAKEGSAKKVLLYWGGLTAVLAGALVLAFAFYGATGFVRSLRPASQARPAEVAGEATAPEVAAPAPSPIPEAPTQAAVDETTYVAPQDSGNTGAVNSADPVRWTLAELAKYFDNIEGWVLPLGTHFATDLSNGRYEAVASKPVGPQSNGTDAGWCGEGQLDCPPHLGLYQVMVTENVEAMMDIATRIQVVSDNGGSVRFQWRFNTETRTAAELVDDYNVAASGGQLGLFIAVADPMMDPATLTFLNKEYMVSYGCWDCLAHTSGVDNPIVSLDDESIGHFGPDTVTLGDSLYPAYVIPVPSPKDEPAFAIDLMVELPKGTTLVFWFGRYDPLDPPG